MLIVTTESIAGKELGMLGLVKGSTIQSKHLGSDISQSFKTLVGGELKSYTEMMNDARALATKRMVQEAEALGADAVVCVRYASAGVMQGAAEVMAYGTAVRFRVSAYGRQQEAGPAAAESQAVRRHRRLGGGRFPLGQRPDRVSAHRVCPSAEEKRQICVRRAGHPAGAGH